MKALLGLFLTFLLFFSQKTEAKYDPRTRPNNHLGIHIIDSNDLPDASDLVNSSGGDWGYVTFVIPETDKNSEKWQTVMNGLRRRHLIPIVRLASTSEDDYWTIPTTTASDDWVRFLNGLNWPVANRYVALFNEPNHAKEWGNTLNPEQYAETYLYLAKKLREASEDFFLLPAAMDASAVTMPGTMDAEDYLTRMLVHKPEIKDYIDGLNSHSYPNPAFSGKPNDLGRGSLRTYLWEKSLYRTLGVEKDLPVFITETGWQHQMGRYSDPKLLSPETVSSYLSQALGTVWNDKNIVAVTPFVLNYQDYPFDHFSWKMYSLDGFYPFYETYRNFPKQPGNPVQKHQYTITGGALPQTLVVNSEYPVKIRLTNTGQAIVDQEQGYSLSFKAPVGINFENINLPVIEPDEQVEVPLLINTGSGTGIYDLSIFMKIPNDNPVLIKTDWIEIVPPPDLEINYQLAWKNDLAVKNVTVLLYDADDRLRYETTVTEANNGHIFIAQLSNVIPGDRYRAVLLVPGYLPRQNYVFLLNHGSKTVMDRLLPFDFNPDGALTAADFVGIIGISPVLFFQRFF